MRAGQGIRIPCLLIAEGETRRPTRPRVLGRKMGVILEVERSKAICGAALRDAAGQSRLPAGGSQTATTGTHYWVQAREEEATEGLRSEVRAL